MLHYAYRKYKVNSEIKKISGFRWLDRSGKEKDSLMDEVCLEVSEEILELVRGDSRQPSENNDGHCLVNA